jgi:pyruvate/2-oxoglutarate dehydrogenase complex dihydrolipoamide dehydrogenase (E3) component
VKPKGGVKPKEAPLRVCIYGAGAIGGYLAQGLSRVEGIELSLVARGAKIYPTFSGAAARAAPGMGEARPAARAVASAK